MIENNDNWIYIELYNKLKKYTIKTEFIKINQNLINYFWDEDITIGNHIKHNSNIDNSDSNDINDKELNNLIKDIQLKLDKNTKLFIKVNSIAGKDIDAFVPFMKIEFIDQFLLLMKYSNRIAEELEDKTSVILQIKKYYELNPSMEFRIFLEKGNILCLSQRNIEHKFDNYTVEFLEILRKKVNELIENKLDILKDLICTIDVYIDISPNYKLKIIDINSGLESDLLLFSEKNIEEIKENINSPDFEFPIKYIKNNTEIIEKNREGNLPLEFQNIREFHKNVEESLNMLNIN